MRYGLSYGNIIPLLLSELGGVDLQWDAPYFQSKKENNFIHFFTRIELQYYLFL